MKKGEYNYQGNIIGIIFPLHCFGRPINVRDFLQKLEIHTKAYVFGVEVTGGGESINPLLEIDEILEDKGNAVMSNYTIIKYISNYIRMGQNPTKERADKAIEDSSDKLQSFIESLKSKELHKVSGKINVVHKTLYRFWKDTFKNKDKGFRVGDSCTSCAVCKTICPVGNIKLFEGRPQWSGSCIDCLACINACPTNAINIKKATVKKVRYRNPYIELKELL